VDFTARKAVLEMAVVRGIEDIISKSMNCSMFPRNCSYFIAALSHQSLWPIGEELQKRSITSLFASMVKTLSTSISANCQSEACVCKTRNLKDALWTAHNLVAGNRRGLCLDCVRRNVMSGQGTDCRFCISE
jgi:hypothetical protein